jgi:hypothetical protein
LSGGGEYETCENGLEPDFDTGGCDEAKYSTVHKVEEVLFAFTMTILFTFFLELNLEMLALRPWVFFRQIFYVLDYFIISVSIPRSLGVPRFLCLFSRTIRNGSSKHFHTTL